MYWQSLWFPDPATGLPAAGLSLSPRAQSLPRPRLEPSAGGGARELNNRGRNSVYQYRSGPQRHHLPAGSHISTGPRGVRHGDRVGRFMASDCNLRSTILVAHVRDHCRISSVLLASILLNKPGVSIHPCIPCPKQLPEKRPLVGCEASTSSSSSLRH
jgi:hypothetical protein